MISSGMSFGADTDGSWALSTGPSLSLATVKVIDNQHIRVVFTEAVEVDTVTLKVNKQSDNSTIRINILTGVTDAPEAVDLTLGDDLIEGGSYSITAIAAVGISGSTITDGAEALKDFSAPVPLKKFSTSLGAAPNPAAVIVKETKTETKDPTPVKEEPVKETIPTPTEELPLTGMNPIFLLLLAIPVSYFLLRRRV